MTPSFHQHTFALCHSGRTLAEESLRCSPNTGLERQNDENAKAMTDDSWKEDTFLARRIYVARFAGFGIFLLPYPQLALWAILCRQLRWLDSCFHPVRTLKGKCMGTP